MQWTFQTLRSAPTAQRVQRDPKSLWEREDAKCARLEEGSKERDNCEYDSITERGNLQRRSGGARMLIAVLVVAAAVGLVVGIVVLLNR
tara:strand:- start:4554 stop:4820 length:267 start_codon:yes stop_codon:yes gene_type:complete